MMVLKLLLFTLIHHSNILMKSYTVLVNLLSLPDLPNVCVCVHMKLLIFHVKVLSEILKRES